MIYSKGHLVRRDSYTLENALGMSLNLSCSSWEDWKRGPLNSSDMQRLLDACEDARSGGGGSIGETSTDPSDFVSAEFSSFESPSISEGMSRRTG